jgi:hypothetical protein
MHEQGTTTLLGPRVSGLRDVNSIYILLGLQHSASQEAKKHSSLAFFLGCRLLVIVLAVMDGYNSTACGDSLFGPSVWTEGCRGGFDFTCEHTRELDVSN